MELEGWAQAGIYTGGAPCAVKVARTVRSGGKFRDNFKELPIAIGLQTAEVMKLTEETLKMAKIANLDYADATDYMTVA